MSPQTESNPLDQDRLEEAVLEFEKARDAGRQPAMHDWRRRYPGLDNEIDQFFQDHNRLARLFGPLRGDDPNATCSWHPQPSLPVVAGYEILGQIAPGGMGIVYHARDLGMDRVVALKLIRPDRLPDAAARQRFENEARACAKLDHPNIVRIWGYHAGKIPGNVRGQEGDGPLGQECAGSGDPRTTGAGSRDPRTTGARSRDPRITGAGSGDPRTTGVGDPRTTGEPDAQPNGEPASDAAACPYIAMEYIPGPNLAERCKSHPLSPRRAAVLVAQIADAVEYSHRREIIHRDLKCANILLTADGTPKIADFGLAKVLLPGEAMQTTAVGTPAYMSPEQATGAPVSPATDVFGLGAILYELLTGKSPYHGQTTEEVIGQARQAAIRAPRDINPQIPKALQRICLKAMAVQPEQRYPSAAALAHELRQFATRLWRMTWAAGMAAALAALALLTGLAWRGTGIQELGDHSAIASTGAPVAAPLKVGPLQVTHYQTEGATAVARGRIGEQSFQARYNDAVTLTVELSAPAYFYVIGFNFDGQEQLLWPMDEAGGPSDGIAPPKLARLRFPVGGDRLYLDDDASGGLQAYVVAASSQPLPPYALWRPGRDGVSWQALPAGDKVWEADAVGAYEVARDVGVDRGSIREALGAPPLAALCRGLLGDGVELVEAIAFPVLPNGSL